MSAHRGKILLIAGGVAALAVIAAGAALLSFDINKFKPDIEAAACNATGLEVRIKGKMGLSLSPFGVSARDIHVANEDGEILSLESLKVGLRLLPLLKKRIETTGCELVRPAVTIVKDAAGRYNFEKAAKKAVQWQLKTDGVKGLRLSHGALVYLDRKTGSKTEVKDVNLTLSDLSIGSTADLIKSASLTGSVDCGEVVQKDLGIANLRATVTADKGVYAFQPLAIGSLVYADRKSGGTAALKEITLTIKDLPAAAISGGSLRNASFTGNLDCKELRYKEVRKVDLHIGNAKSPLRVEKGVIHLAPLAMDIFGARGEGNATADTTQANALYKINVKVPQLDFEKLGQAFGARKVIGGKGYLHASLTMEAKGSRHLLGSMDGTVSLRGDNLVIYLMDLDKVLSMYGTSEEFNLVDLSVFLIAGPPGSLALKDLYNRSWKGHGIITRLVSHWKIKGGVASATDCAFTTHHNRVALKGRLDLVRERYDNVIVALLDDKGCVKFQQSISGPIDNPHISTVSAVGSLAGPLVRLYTKAERLVRGGTCEVFYSGSVQQPR